MKKTIISSIIGFAVFFSTSFAIAQDDAKKTPEERAKKTSVRLTKQLGLDEAQKKEVYNLVLEHAQGKAELKEEEKGTARKEAAAANKENFQKEMKEILTPEQFTKYEEIQAKKQEKQAAKKEERKAAKKEEKKANK